MQKEKIISCLGHLADYSWSREDLMLFFVTHDDKLKISLGFELLDK